MCEDISIREGDMSKDSEVTKRMTKAMKSVDKLVRDVREDIGGVLLAMEGIKELVDDIKDKFKGSDHKEV
jgi:hypothetical protein